MNAALAGVYLHGLAGDLITEETGSVGIYAGELLDVIPAIINQLSQGTWPLRAPPMEEQMGMAI
jgi:hypothetical protein